MLHGTSESARKPSAVGQIRALVPRYSGIALISVKEKLAYRFDFFFSLAISLVCMVLLVYLWRAVYRNATALDLPLRDLVTYVCLGQAFNFARIGWAQRRLLFSINASLQSGDIVFDLIRPVDYQAMQFSQVLGQYVAEMILINAPAYLVALLVFHIAPP